MKKYKKYLYISYLTILFVLFSFCLEFISFNFIYSNLYWEFHNFITGKPCIITWQPLDYSKTKKEISNISLSERNDETIPYKKDKSPILFLGCSYTYGQGIKTDKIFSSQLQNYTKRKTKNISAMGAGIGDIYYMLANYKFDKDFNPEWVIYTYMYNQILRIKLYDICRYMDEYYERYKNKSFADKLKYYINKSYTVKLFNNRKFVHSEENIYKVQQYMFIKIYNLIKKQYPNSKFIFLIFNDLKDSEHEGIERNSLNPEKWQAFNNYDDIYVISTDDLTGNELKNNQQKYKLNEDPFQDPHHPNEKAWEIIVPPLCKKFNL